MSFLHIGFSQNFLIDHDLSQLTMKEKNAGHRTVSQMASATFAVSRAFAAGKGKNGPSEGATESMVVMEFTYAPESLKVKYLR